MTNKVKIIHVISCIRLGGAEKLVSELVPCLNDHEFSTDAILITKDNSQSLLESFQIGKNRFSLLHWQSAYSFGPLNLIRLLKAVRKYDIIHVHLFPTFYQLFLISFFINGKLVYTEHNTNNRRRHFQLTRWLDKIIYRRFDMVVSCSQAVHVALANYLNNQTCIKLIPNGINVELFENAKSYSKDIFFSKEDVIIIQVSNFREQKDQYTLIKSMTYLPLKYKLLLVGEGEKKLELEKIVVEFGLKDRVLFLGMRNDIPRLLKTSDIVVLSSKYEGLSLAALEGMASGRPFIASRAPGLTELVSGYGLLFEIGDSMGLSLLIKYTVENKQSYSSISQLCVQRSKQYSILSMTNSHKQLYRDLTSSG